MTNYHLTPPTTLPSLVVQEAKEKRRKVLEAAAKVRRENYQRFLEKKRRLQADNQEQIERWRKGTLTTQQKQAIDKLAQQTAQTKKAVTQLLAIAQEIKKNTIDQILARDDVALAFTNSRTNDRSSVRSRWR